MRFFAALLLVCFAGGASAQVRYDFTAFSSFPVLSIGIDSLKASFTLTTPDFIVPAGKRVSFPALSLDACSISSPSGFSCGRIDIGSYSAQMDNLSFGIAGTGVGITYYFDKGAFSTIGTHMTSDLSGFGAGQSASLTVTAVPEPETYAMMVAGLGMMGFIVRRRKVRAVNTSA